MSLFEIAREVALIAHADPVHNLFGVQERVLQKTARFLHPEPFEILRERHSRFRLEEIAKIARREIYSA